MILTKLSTGYWHAYWNPEVWAQWIGLSPREQDFFHPEWTFTRQAEAEAAVASAERRAK